MTLRALIDVVFPFLLTVLMVVIIIKYRNMNEILYAGERGPEQDSLRRTSPILNELIPFSIAMLLLLLLFIMIDVFSGTMAAHGVLELVSAQNPTQSLSIQIILATVYCVIFASLGVYYREIRRIIRDHAAFQFDRKFIFWNTFMNRSFILISFVFILVFGANLTAILYAR